MELTLKGQVYKKVKYTYRAHAGGKHPRNGVAHIMERGFSSAKRNNRKS